MRLRDALAAELLIHHCGRPPCAGFASASAGGDLSATIKHVRDCAACRSVAMQELELHGSALASVVTPASG